MATTEARELELVGKVEMRIALAKDENLESILKPYLPPLLLKLASDHQTVRNKVNSLRFQARDVFTDSFGGDINMSTHQDTSCRKSVRLPFLAMKVACNGNDVCRGIVLPVAALLKQYKEHSESSLIRHFDLMFIQQSVGKLTSKVCLASVLTFEL